MCMADLLKVTYVKGSEMGMPTLRRVGATYILDYLQGTIYKETFELEV